MQEMRAMRHRVEVHFESIVLQDQRVRGPVRDYVVCVVHFAFRYRDGRVDPGCIATVRHRIRLIGRPAVDVIVPAAYQSPAYSERLKREIAEYYLDRVGPQGTVIRLGPKGASPLILGVPRESPSIVAFEIEQVTNA